eukprot:scaffold32683_cov20-Tisochrysis_lutea.AAC.1
MNILQSRLLALRAQTFLHRHLQCSYIPAAGAPYAAPRPAAAAGGGAGAPKAPESAGQAPLGPNARAILGGAGVCRGGAATGEERSRHGSLDGIWFPICTYLLSEAVIPHASSVVDPSRLVQAGGVGSLCLCVDSAL